MKTQQSNRKKWVVDAALFGLFIAEFFLDFTGLELHQWLGLLAASAAAYHLVIHWTWVKTVTRRFFTGTSTQARGYYLVDLMMFGGLGAITVTGLVISSWLNLTLAAYETWRVVHVLASITTLASLVVKTILHWRWIAGLFQRRASRLAVRGTASQPVAAGVPSVLNKPMSRREFLKVMGVTGVISVVALSRAVQGLQGQVLGTLTNVEAASLPERSASSVVPTTMPATATSAAAATPTAAPSSTATATAVPIVAATATAVPQACSVRCPRGCSYPGHCRRYQDANGNGRCDLGECL